LARCVKAAAPMAMSIRASVVRCMHMASPPLALALVLFSTPALALQPLNVFVASALKRNPDALEATANLVQQEAFSDVALGRVMPGLSARGSWTKNQYVSTVSFGPGQPTVTVVPDHQWDGSATLTVPLIDLAGWQHTRAAGTAADSSSLLLDATRLQVQAQVVQDYYQLIAYLALVASSQQALDVSREGLKLAKSRYDAGVAPVLDVDRATADVELRTQQLADAGLQASLAARALESSSDVTPDTSAVVPLTDDLHAEAPLEAFEEGLDHLPAVASAVEATRASEQQAYAQRFVALPTVAGSVSERGTSAPGFVGHNWTWQALVGFTWALDLTTFASIRGQDAAVDANRARERRARLASRDNIHRFWQTVASDIARGRSARAGLAAATHAEQQARDRYRAGTVTQLDLLQAQRDAFLADVTRIDADADLVNARAQLRIAAGHSLLERSNP